LFVGLSFVLNERNAKYLLSGYNTMSAAEQASYPLGAFLRFFKRFHWFLGGSLLIIGLVLYYFVDEGTTGMLIGIYPIAAYMYFIWQSGSFQAKNANTRNINKWAAGILGITLLLVIGLSWMGRKEDVLRVEDHQLMIGGMYGTTLSAEEIAGFSLVPELPLIDRKKHGFASGQQYKGRFKTVDGDEVLLVLNSMQRPFIKIDRVDDMPIYYSSSKVENTSLFKDVQAQLSLVE